jgi:WD40 repeat protein
VVADAQVAFFSYCREDSNFALRLAEDLKTSGALVWIDQLDIEPGKEWDNAIEKAVTQCQRMLLILSPASVSSRNVRNEIAFALDEQKSILPILYQDCTVPLQLRRIQSIDFRADYARGLKVLLKAFGVPGASQPITSAHAEAPAKLLDSDTIKRARSDKASRPSASTSGLKRERKPTKRTVGTPLQAKSGKIASRTSPKKSVPVVQAVPPAQKRKAETIRKAPAPVPPSAKVVRVPSEHNGREFSTVKGHNGEVLGVALSADGRLAVSSSYDFTIKVWNISEGRELRTLEGHKQRVNGVAVSADGRLAVSSSVYDSLKVWDVQSGRALHSVRGRFTGVALSADGRLAVSSSYESKLKIWDVQSARVVRTLEGEAAWGRVAMSADGRFAILACNQPRVWDVSSGRQVLTLEGHYWRNHPFDVTDVALNGDGSLAVSGGLDNELIVWDLRNGNRLRVLKGHNNAVTSAAVSAGKPLGISTSIDKTLKMWDLESGAKLASLDLRYKPLCCAISSDAKTIMAGDSRGGIHYLRLD